MRKVEYRGMLERIIIASYFVVFFFAYIKWIPFWTCNVLYAIALMYFFIVSLKKRSEAIYLLLIVLSVLLFGFISGAYTGIMEATVYLKTVTYIYFSYYYCRDGIGKKYSNLIFWIVEIVLLYFIFISTQNINAMFTTLSRNYISVFSIMATLVLYLEDEREGITKAKLYPALINFVVCAGGMGRGGILSAAFLLLGIIYIRYFIDTTVFRRILFIFLSIGILILVWSTPFFVEQYYNLFNRLAVYGLSNTGRYQIWVAYLKQLFRDPFDLLFGGRIKNIAIIKSFDFNLHNTFLQMHFTYGLLFFTLMVVSLAKTGIRFVKKKKILILVLMGSFILRAYLDQLGYAFSSEVFLYYFIFLGAEQIKDGKRFPAGRKSTLKRKKNYIYRQEEMPC